MNHDRELAEFYGLKLIKAAHDGDFYAIILYSMEAFVHAVLAKPSLMTTKQAKERKKRKLDGLREVQELMDKYAKMTCLLPWI